MWRSIYELPTVLGYRHGLINDQWSSVFFLCKLCVSTSVETRIRLFTNGNGVGQAWEWLFINLSVKQAVKLWTQRLCRCEIWYKRVPQVTLRINGMSIAHLVRRIYWKKMFIRLGTGQAGFIHLLSLMNNLGPVLHAVSSNVRSPLGGAVPFCTSMWFLELTGIHGNSVLHGT